VGGLTPRYANQSGTFDTTTRPTLAQVEAYIDQVSGIVNSYLAQAGFSVPVTQPDVTLALTMFVQEEVAAVAEGVNGSGRFGPTTNTPGKRGRFAVLTEDARTFIEGQAFGFELLGAERKSGIADSIAFRETDQSGNLVAPIFEREAFGNEFKEWDR
jgi:hypothetical protein